MLVNNKCKISIYSIVVLLSFFIYPHVALTKTPDSYDELIVAIKESNNVKLIFALRPECESCDKDVAEIIKISKKYKNKEMTIVVFVVDGSAEKITGLEANRKNLQIYEYPINICRKIFKNIGLIFDDAMPYVSLINKKGIVVFEGRYSVSALDMAIDYLVNQ